MISLQSLQVGGLYVTKREGGWVVEATPGLLWSLTDGWVFEPSQPNEEFLKSTRFESIEKAIEFGLIANSDIQHIAENSVSDEYEIKSKNIKQSCIACGNTKSDLLCKAGMKLELPTKKTSADTQPHFSFVGPIRICHSCLSDFMGAFKRAEEAQLGKVSEGTKIILGLLDGTREASDINDLDTYEILLTTSRFLYPLLIWLKARIK